MYQHTQYGWIIIAVAVPVVIFLAIASLAAKPASAAGMMVFTAICLAALLALFGSLTVKADNEGIRFHFGPGVIRRHIPYKDIVSVKRVRNHWYYGWGLRWYGRGWLYNVSGLDALEIALRNGKFIRVGTNQPDELLRFVSSRTQTG